MIHFSLGRVFMVRLIAIFSLLCYKRPSSKSLKYCCINKSFLKCFSSFE